MQKSRIKQYLTEFVKLPEDLVYHDAVITILGNHELHIENYKLLLEYHPERICVGLQQSKLMITGIKLQIIYYTSDEMHILGEIQRISYEQ